MKLALQRLSLALVFCVGLNGCAKTPFEKEHDRAEARNPRWLSIELDTSDKRRKYREGELITLVSRYSSTVPYQYRVEVDYDNVNGASDRLQDSLDPTVNLPGFVITCCFSHIVGITEEPRQFGRPHYLKLKPGKHEIWLSTRRVYPWSAPQKNYDTNDWICASNLLKITVVPSSK